MIFLKIKQEHILNQQLQSPYRLTPLEWLLLLTNGRSKINKKEKWISTVKIKIVPLERDCSLTHSTADPHTVAISSGSMLSKRLNTVDVVISLFPSEEVLVTTASTGMGTKRQLEKKMQIKICPQNYSSSYLHSTIIMGAQLNSCITRRHSSHRLLLRSLHYEELKYKRYCKYKRPKADLGCHYAVIWWMFSSNPCIPIHVEGFL